jgi:hypothetical protein
LCRQGVTGTRSHGVGEVVRAVEPQHRQRGRGQVLAGVPQLGPAKLHARFPVMYPVHVLRASCRSHRETLTHQRPARGRAI